MVHLLLESNKYHCPRMHHCLLIYVYKLTEPAITSIDCIVQLQWSVTASITDSGYMIFTLYPYTLHPTPNLPQVLPFYGQEVSRRIMR